MKSRLSIAIFVVLFVAAIVTLFSLDSDIETLSKIGISQKKPAIVVNQVGYLPQWQKIAFLRQSTSFTQNKVSTSPVRVIDLETRQEVATVPLGEKTFDSMTQDAVTVIDFSSVTRSGKYYLQQGKLRSVPFKIGRNIYDRPLVTLLRSYYLQRCGVELDDPVTGIYHPPCHLKDGFIARQDPFHDSGEFVPAIGGWHDTGAYSKYVATTTVTIARLLNLYEQNPELFPDRQLNIPESGNGRSDLLDEMEFGLDWLLKMQRSDGVVYRKLSGVNWPVGLAPDEDNQTRYIYGISTPETAKFAAVMAIASRNWQASDRTLAEKYLSAAELAWQYLQTQPEMKVDAVEWDDSGSDRYLASEFNREASLKTDLDDRLWAAAELYITTGQAEFADYFADNLDRVEYTLFEWKNPAPLGLIDYLYQNPRPVAAELTSKIQTKIQQRADLILNKVQQSAYNLANDRFIWGSNRMTAEEGITLFYAYKLTQKTEYLNAAIGQLNYLLGRNHFNQTFVTDLGTNPVKNLSNLYTRAKQVPLPGVMVGGANGDAQDGMVVQNRGQLSYVDDERSYTTNGNKTDYNASLISLIFHLINPV